MSPRPRPTRTLGIALLVSLLPLSGCSQSLGFNFLFATSDDFGTGGNDLAMSLDLATSDDMVNQSIGDLRRRGHDLTSGSTDLASGGNSSDLLSPADLGAKAGDLYFSDLAQPDMLSLSKLGNACDANSVSACGALTCITKYSTASGDVLIAGNYCTKSCTKDDQCILHGGLCRPLGNDMICMPSCGTGVCSRANYLCCQYAGGDMATGANVCSPPQAPNFLCAAGGG